MFKIKIYLLDTTLELFSNSKAVIATAIHGIFLMEMLSDVKFMTEAYHVHGEQLHVLIGEYNSVAQFQHFFEAMPPSP